jgi:molybdenum cofactor biosynthesis protein MoaC
MKFEEDLQSMDDSPTLTHVDEDGKIRMVDVTAKTDSQRSAVAAGSVLLGEEAFNLVKANRIAKGDVLTTAQMAGIMGAKQTSNLIPLCHPVMLSGVDVSLELNEPRNSVDITAIAKSFGPTGVEMEALSAVSLAALTVYDMCKSVSKEIVVSDIRLLAKTGGQSGDYRRTEDL